MLYTNKENNWLPLYLPINGKILFVGHGKVAVGPIDKNSAFTGSGNGTSCTAATSVEDMLCPEGTLKAVNVIDGKRIHEHFILFEAVAYNEKKAFNMITFPFYDKDPTFELKFRPMDRLYKVFERVNSRYTSKNDKGIISSYGFVWDTRCVGVGGVKDDGVTDRSHKLFDEAVKDTPRLKNDSLLLKLEEKYRRSERWSVADKQYEECIRLRGSGKCSILFTPNPPVLPSFFETYHPRVHSSFVTWGGSSCWYDHWVELYAGENLNNNLQGSPVPISSSLTMKDLVSHGSQPHDQVINHVLSTYDEPRSVQGKAPDGTDGTKQRDKRKSRFADVKSNLPISYGDHGGARSKKRSLTEDNGNNVEKIKRSKPCTAVKSLKRSGNTESDNDAGNRLIVNEADNGITVEQRAERKRKSNDDKQKEEKDEDRDKGREEIGRKQKRKNEGEDENMNMLHDKKKRKEEELKKKKTERKRSEQDGKDGQDEDGIDKQCKKEKKNTTKRKATSSK